MRRTKIAGLYPALFIILCSHFVIQGCDPSDNTENAAEAVSETPAPMSQVPEMVASCSYTNPFSNMDECKGYTGAGWALSEAEMDCASEPASVFREGSCEMSSVLGTCEINGDSALAVTVFFPGDDSAMCAEMFQGCEVFAAGVFTPTELCEGVSLDTDDLPPATDAPVFQPMEKLCQASTNDTPGLSDDNQVCTWQSIGGCTEPGRMFTDYADCSPVMTQRPFFPVPPSTYKTAEDDPIREDEAFLTELEWVKGQSEACGCVCCHTSAVAPNGAAAFDTSAAGIWTDTFSEHGLAIAAGWIDSSPLGAHDAEDNNGFDRSRTGLPTTDVERMIRFFEGELNRRGVERSRFEGATPTGGPLYTQGLYMPTQCEDNEGVLADGTMIWNGGGARYIYVLEAGSENPGVPPNMDQPEGTLWKLDVSPNSRPLPSGIRYGSTPEGSAQVLPSDNPPPALVPGQTYYLYVLADISIPITRCLFEFPDGVDPSNDELDDAERWSQSCTSDSNCMAPTDYCAIQPGDTEGYCTVHCDSTTLCRQLGVPADWTCNALTCDVEAFTWCGPNSEIAESNGFLKVCE